MSQITGLGYIGIGAADLDAWRTFATGVLGLQPSSGPAGDDCLFLRCDSRAYRIAVEKGTDGALHYLGFEVATPQRLAELATELREKGLTLTAESAETCAARQVEAMYSTVDPFGNRLEFVVGHHESTDPFVSPTGASFVIDDMGFGHVMLMVDDIAKFVEYYMDTLGFRLSDTIGSPPTPVAYFLHCNPRHHTLAGVSVPGVPNSLSHLMLQVDDLATVGRAYDKVQKGGIPIVASLGQHTNDHMVSFYCMSPSSTLVEFGVDGRRIDEDTWVVGHYEATSYWGHANAAAPAAPA